MRGRPIPLEAAPLCDTHYHTVPAVQSLDQPVDVEHPVHATQLRAAVSPHLTALSAVMLSPHTHHVARHGVLTDAISGVSFRSPWRLCNSATDGLRGQIGDVP